LGPNRKGKHKKCQFPKQAKTGVRVLDKAKNSQRDYHKSKAAKRIHNRSKVWPIVKIVRSDESRFLNCNRRHLPVLHSAKEKTGQGYAKNAVRTGLSADGNILHGK
jgi:hypothetical protein